MNLPSRIADAVDGVGLKAAVAHVMCMAGACLLGHALRSWELSAGLLLLAFGMEWVVEMYGSAMRDGVIREIREQGEATRSMLADLADADGKVD